MDSEKIAAILAEEIRTNAELRRQMGMSEGSESGIVGQGEDATIGILTDDGFPFFIKVERG
jgi:hypothetical protein